MPMTIDQDDLHQLAERVREIPPCVRSGTINLYEGSPTFTFKWDDNAGHVITWKEPRK